MTHAHKRCHKQVLVTADAQNSRTGLQVQVIQEAFLIMEPTSERLWKAVGSVYWLSVLYKLRSERLWLPFRCLYTIATRRMQVAVIIPMVSRIKTVSRFVGGGGSSSVERRADLHLKCVTNASEWLNYNPVNTNHIIILVLFECFATMEITKYADNKPQQTSPHWSLQLCNWLIPFFSFCFVIWFASYLVIVEFTIIDLTGPHSQDNSFSLRRIQAHHPQDETSFEHVSGKMNILCVNMTCSGLRSSIPRDIDQD